jgi:hypothetical protein
VGLFYSFCKTFISERTAFLAAALLAFSHYVMSFGKIGYNNLQALFAFSLALAVAAWALRTQQSLAFAVLGSVLALCFYLFPAALYVVPLPLLLLLLYYPPVSRPALNHWLVMLAAWLALLYPLLLQPAYWLTKVPGTLFNRPELTQSAGVVIDHFAVNIFYSLLSIFYIPESHYVAVASVDPLTAILVSIGGLVFIRQLRRQRFAIFTALGFGLFLVLVGASHDYDTPPITRLFLLLPWFAMFAAWGWHWIEANAHSAGLFKPNYQRAVLPVLLVIIAGLNLYQAYYVAYIRFMPIQSAESMFIHVTEEIQKADRHRPKNVAVLVGDTWGVAGLVEFQNVYPHLAWFHIYQIKVASPRLPEAQLPLLADRDTLVLLSPYLEPEWQDALDAPLRELGKTACTVTDLNGRYIFMLYYAPEILYNCPSLTH